MFDFLKHARGAFSRRDLFVRGSALAAPALLAQAAAPGAGLKPGPDIYQSIGVKPIINGRGTLTVMGGSLELPEVRAAMDAASKHFVQLDEMMAGVGRRIAEITGAESAVVTSGCAAGMAHATAACVAGANPDLHVRIPNLAGFAKDEVIIPKHSRNVYDAAVRSIGVKIIEVDSIEELEAACGPRVAMLYFFATEFNASGPMSLDKICAVTNKRGIPVFVDAAAEKLTIPNVHLQKGATLVGYSGGKCLRGPQCAGFVIGRKDLIQAMWVNSAPHHGYGRAMKVGKEEAMGMLMAIEMWGKRDHDAEWKAWMSAMEHIRAEVTKVPGVTSTIRMPEGLSNYTPTVEITWDPSKLGLDGNDVNNTLWAGEPRIAVNGFHQGVSIIAYMLQPGEEKIIATRLREVLSTPPATKKAAPKPPAADLSGHWDFHIQYFAGATTHPLYLKQDGAKVVGTHQGDFVKRDLHGTVDGDSVRLSSSMQEREMGDVLSYTFTGTLTGDTITGSVDMGEYLKATFTAKRHAYQG